jgi:Tfp pilus assembly protein PilV
MDSPRGLRTSRKPRYAGVTLTETIVASTLLLISIIPLIKAMTAAHGMDRVIDRRSWSLLLAQQELERIQAQSVYHYDESLAVTSHRLGDGFLCTITDDSKKTLRTVTVAVGLDLNGDGALAANEVEVNLRTALARRWPGP